MGILGDHPEARVGAPGGHFASESLLSCPGPEKGHRLEDLCLNDDGLSLHMISICLAFTHRGQKRFPM